MSHDFGTVEFITPLQDGEVVVAMTIHNDRLYVATSFGVWRLSEGEVVRLERLMMVESSEGMCVET